MDKDIKNTNKENQAEASRPDNTISNDQPVLYYIPLLNDKNKKWLRAIAAIVVFCFVFTQTGISLAIDDWRINPEHISKERSGYIGIKEYEKERELQNKELKQRYLVESNREQRLYEISGNLNKGDHQAHK